jgi:hypothetical protein
MIDVFLAIAVVSIWNGYLMYKMLKDDKQVSEKEESSEVRK